jgi:anti-sigma-K factor RskA
MNYRNSNLRSLLAGEYVLGTLHGATRRRFERLLTLDSGLHDLVGEWQAVLASLSSALEPVTPPPELWTRLQARVQRRGG